MDWAPEEEQEFWERLGFKQGITSLGTMEWFGWYYPDGSFQRTLPSIHDLNALFKWGVSLLQPEAIKLVPVFDTIQGKYGERWGCILIPKGWGQHISVIVNNPNPALALAEALYKALKEGK